MKSLKTPERKTLIVLPLAALLAFAGNAFSQDNKAKTEDDTLTLPTFTVDAQKDTGYVGTNSLSASRAAIPVVDMPSSIVVLTRELIDDIGAFDVSEVTRFASGVSDATMPAQDSLSFRVRGNSPTVCTDGFRSGGEGTQELAEVERVEVLKGPSAILFARGGSAGGVVNRITKSPLSKSQTYFRAQTGLYDANRMEFDSTGPVPGTNGKFLYRAILAAQDDDGYCENVKTKRYIIAPSFTYKFTQDTYLTLKYSYYWNKQTQYVGVPMDISNPSELRLENKLFAVTRKRSFADPNDFQLTDRQRYDLSFGTKLSESLRSSVGLQYADTISARQSTRPSGSPMVQANGNVILSWMHNYARDDKTRVYNDNLYQFKLGPTAHTLIFGAEVSKDGPAYQNQFPFTVLTTANIYQPVPAATSYPTITSKKYPANEQLSNQAYVLESFKAFKDRLVVTGGATRNYFKLDNYASATNTWSTQKGYKNTAQYGAVVRPVSGLSVYYGYNENFSPNSTTLARENADGTVTPIGIAPPQMSKSSEIGVKVQLLDDRLSFSVARYDTDLTNRTQTIIGTSYIRLIGGGTYKGWESDLFFKATKNLSLVATYAYTDAKDRLGAQIETVSPDTSSVWARYNFDKGALKGLGMSFGGNYQDGYVLMNGSTALSVQGRILLDCGAYYSWKNYKLQLNVKNLADKFYIAGGYLPQRVFIGDGRNIKLSLTYSF